MKILNSLINLVIALATFSVGTALADDNAPKSIVRTIILENSMQVLNQVPSQSSTKPERFGRIADEDVTTCWTNINDGKLIKGSCWVFITSKYEISYEQLRIYLSDKVSSMASPIEIELVSVGTKAKLEQRKILVSRRGYYDIKVTANADRSNPVFTIFKMD